MHIKQTHISTARPNLLKEHVSLTHGLTNGIKHENTTMCIVHKGFRGFRAVSPASILGGNMIGFKARNPLRHHTLNVVHNYEKSILHINGGSDFWM